MLKRSAGILPYKYENGHLLVYLEHPGGPYWKGINKYSICKGEYSDEDILKAAIREFQEESGFKIDENKEMIFLGSAKQKNNKLVTIFAINQDFDVNEMKSNTFMLEWPKNSSEMKEFPEMDSAKWFTIEEARKVIFEKQRIFIDKLEKKLKM